MNGIAAHRAVMAVLLAVALASGLCTCGGPAGPIDGGAAFAHTKAIVEVSPRPTGSEGLRKSADYIKAEIAKLGLQPREQVWTQSVERYGQSRELSLRNLWTEIPGTDPDKGPILLLACHYDSKYCADHPNPEHNFEFVGAVDSAAACGVLLELARVVTDHQTSARAGGDGAPALITPNIWLAWFDGEECIEFDWIDEKSLLGSRHFAEQLAADKSRFPGGLAARMKTMVLMDLIGDKNIKIDRDTRSNAKLLEIFEAAATRLGEQDRMYQYDSPMVDDHVPFKRFGVAVIDLIDFRWRAPYEWQMTAEDWQQRGVTKPPDGTYTAWWHSADDTLDQVSAESLAFIGNLVWHALPDIEAAFYAH